MTAAIILYLLHYVSGSRGNLCETFHLLSQRDRLLRLMGGNQPDCRKLINTSLKAMLHESITGMKGLGENYEKVSIGAHFQGLISR